MKVVVVCRPFDLVLKVGPRFYGVSRDVVGDGDGWTEPLANHSPVQLQNVPVPVIVLPRSLQSDDVTPVRFFGLFLDMLHSFAADDDDMVEVCGTPLSRIPPSHLAMFAALSHHAGFFEVRDLLDAEMVQRCLPELDLDLFYFARTYGLGQVRNRILLGLINKIGGHLDGPLFGITRTDLIGAVYSRPRSPWAIFLDVVRIFARLPTDSATLLYYNFEIVMSDTARLRAFVDTVLDLDLTGCARDVLLIVSRIRCPDRDAIYALNPLVHHLHGLIWIASMQ